MFYFSEKYIFHMFCGVNHTFIAILLALHSFFDSMIPFFFLFNTFLFSVWYALYLYDQHYYHFIWTLFYQWWSPTTTGLISFPTSLTDWDLHISREIYTIYSLGNTSIQLTKKRQNHCLLRKVSNLLLFLSIMSNCKLPKVINVLLLLFYTQKKIKCRQNVNSFNCHRKQRFSPLCQ